MVKHTLYLLNSYLRWNYPVSLQYIRTVTMLLVLIICYDVNMMATFILHPPVVMLSL